MPCNKGSLLWAPGQLRLGGTERGTLYASPCHGPSLAIFTPHWVVVAVPKLTTPQQEDLPFLLKFRLWLLVAYGMKPQS